MPEYSVGPGIQQLMAERGDEARSNEVFLVQTPGSKVSQAMGRDAIYYWLEVDNATRVVPFRG